MVELESYVLRFWETEFSQLRPSKNNAGNRIYREHDLNVIKLIKKLLYDDKYTIEGARQQLKLMDKTEKDEQLSLIQEQEKEESPAIDSKFVSEIVKDLKKILDLIDNVGA